MKVLTDCKVPDPQILFVAVGDATSDRAPLQVGQFESTAELMDQWLTWSFLEGGGGGSSGVLRAGPLLPRPAHGDGLLGEAAEEGLPLHDRRRAPLSHAARATSSRTVIGDRLDDDLEVEEIVAELQKTFVPVLPHPRPRPARSGASAAGATCSAITCSCMEAPRGHLLRDRRAPSSSARAWRRDVGAADPRPEERGNERTPARAPSPAP